MFSIFRPEPDIFGKDRERDLSMIKEVISNSYLKWARFSIKNESDYDKYLKVKNKFEKWGEYEFAIKDVNWKLINSLYNNINANLEKKIYIIDRALIKEKVWNLDDMQLFIFWKTHFDGNLVLSSRLWEKFRKINKFSILLELLSISYMNDISKHKQYKLFKNLCLINRKYLSLIGLSYKNFI